MPMLVGKYANFFGQGGAPGWEIKVWSNFQEAIQRQGKAVQEADKKRIADGKPEYKSMDPTRFEVAVSVWFVIDWMDPQSMVFHKDHHPRRV